MTSITKADVEMYVSENIGSFHHNRLKKLQQLSFETVLQRKNPYLFKAKNIQTANDFVKSILDAYLSAQEE